MKTPALILAIKLRPDFMAKLKVPLDMTPAEAHRLSVSLLAQSIDPSEAAKYAVSDPSIYPSITE